MKSDPAIDEFVRYDSALPIAVFLGPSLERRRAEEILPANYYPPVRMGDVYRLIGSGVRLIVLIDGIFHHQAPVWQREILEALRNGITVVGASSMGALRAAELHPFGMIGHGTIFEWYRDGVIDGDDEVALNHGDASCGFRALSEPLVNIRATLAEAVRAELLSNSEAAALIAAAKRVCYAERSWPALLHGLPEVRHAALRKFIETQSINLKERDALSALHCAAALRDAPPVALEPVGRVRPSLYHAEAALRRGFLHPTGCLVSGRRVLFEALKSSEQIDALRPELMRRHFLLQWARDHEVSCPDEHLDEFRARRGMPDHSLPALGLTPQERDMALAEEALLAWLLARGPEHFGLRFDRHRRYVEALLPLLAPDAPQERRAEFLTRAAETCFLADWARQNDFKLPAEDFAAFLGAWESSRNISPRDAWLKSVALSENDYLAISEERALYHLLGMRGPAWFGYESWSFERAFLNHLQYTGAAADFVAKMHLPVAA